MSQTPNSLATDDRLNNPLNAGLPNPLVPLNVQVAECSEEHEQEREGDQTPSQERRRGHTCKNIHLSILTFATFIF